MVHWLAGVLLLLASPAHAHDVGKARTATEEAVTFEATMLSILFTVPAAGVRAVQVVADVVLGIK